MIIGISGKARSGKDTFANMLAEEMNKVSYPPYVMMAFAHELKTRCQTAFDMSYEQLWGEDKEVPDKRYIKEHKDPRPIAEQLKEVGMIPGSPVDVYWTAREIMQDYGAFYRTIDNQFWIKNLFRVAEDKEYTNIIITDVRYHNEAGYIQHKKGGYVIRVERDSKDDVHNMQHPSEIELDDYGNFDFTVNNNGTLDDLGNTTKDVCRFLKVSENDLKKLGVIKGD
jgi:hypothetical protein